MKPKWQKYFTRVLEETAELSYARKLKVGAIAVRDYRVIVTGYNGRLPGEDNCCEDEIRSWDHNSNTEVVELKTRSDVEHAERNLICCAAKKGIALEGASLFITHSPCIDCARAIANVGFIEVYYKEVFNKSEGLVFLQQRDIKVIQLES